MDHFSLETFDPSTLAADLYEVRRIYANFFAGLREDDWRRPVKGGPKEWNLGETVAHLCALSGAGLESIRCALQGVPYQFEGLTDRFQFNAYNRRGIAQHLSMPASTLSSEFLGVLDQAAAIARSLDLGQAEITTRMPIYNRPVKVSEALSIIMFHAGLHHSAQVAEPAGVPPLWKQLPPEVRHRVIGRVMNAFSLLYRRDLGGSLQAVLVFRVDGPGGGSWFVNISPQSCFSGEGTVASPDLTIHLRKRYLLPDAYRPAKPTPGIADRSDEADRQPAPVFSHGFSFQCRCPALRNSRQEDILR